MQILVDIHNCCNTKGDFKVGSFWSFYSYHVSHTRLYILLTYIASAEQY